MARGQALLDEFVEIEEEKEKGGGGRPQG